LETNWAVRHQKHITTIKGDFSKKPTQQNGLLSTSRKKIFPPLKVYYPFGHVILDT